MHLSPMTTRSTSSTRYGVESLRSLQGDSVPGSVPRKSPPKATGGPFLALQQTRRQGRNHKVSRAAKHQTFTLMHWNAEGVSNKKTDLEHLLHEQDVHICCIQETHLQPARFFKIRGYQCFRNDRTGRSKGGILTLVRNNINATVLSSHMEDSEIQTLSIKKNEIKLTLVNMYSPNDKDLSLDKISVDEEKFLLVGDLNSHSQSWGYSHMDRRGEEIEGWQDDNRLNLINRLDDPPTFYSRRWHTTTTPDLAFCTDDVHGHIKRHVGEQLGGSDHRPVFLKLDGKIPTASTAPRWNYKKADWSLYGHLSNELCRDITVGGRDINHVVKDFNTAILKTATKSIPRGARRTYKPYWNDELEELHKQLSEARQEAENHPSNENNIRLQHAKAKFIRQKLQARRKSWREKTASLNLEKDGRKLWGLVKQLNDEECGKCSTTLEENGELLTGKCAANRLAKNYKAVSDVAISRERQRQGRREIRERATKEAEECMKHRLTMKELTTALKHLKRKKSPGPDGVTNEMLINLGSTARCKLLEIFNHSWEIGALPQVWREATMVAILKKGKNPKEATSYRPISLTSCIGKTMERIVNQRLKLYLETNSLLAAEQAGFRQFRSTEDQTTYLSQEIEDSFQDQKVVLTAWIDLQRAFDKVWTEGLIVKLMRNKIGANMLKWIKSFLYNRRARVNLDQTHSRKFLLRHGVPQGGVLSPTLFLVFINDLVAELPRGVKAALYADDLVLWCAEEYATTATLRMKEALNVLNNWTEEWCVTINKDKSSTTLFSLSPKQKAGTLTLGTSILKEGPEATYLGVIFDKRQTWKSHISHAEGLARRKLSIMRKLAGTTWGASEQVLKTIYQGTVRPHLEYSSAAWSNASKTNLQTLDKVQNQALRIVTGAMKSTPIQHMEKLTGIQPLHERRKQKTIIQAEKYKCIPDHPMKARLQGFTKNRLKRSSFVHQAKKISRELPFVNEVPATPLTVQDNLNLDHSSINICTDIPSIQQVEDTIGKRALTMAMICDQYPPEAWIHAYTDGSATEAVRDGGAGIFISHPNGTKETASETTGKQCSNYRAEVEALRKAARMVKDSTQECLQVVFLTDARSVLQALQNNKEVQLAEELQQLAINCRVSVQWIPAHCGIAGNEQADQLAKQGARGQQEDNTITYQEKITIIKTMLRPRQEKDPYHLLPRPEQVILGRLRTGHCRLRAHMHRMFRLVPSPTCPCGEGDQTVEHVLQECQRHQQERNNTWPSETTAHQKLHGGIEDLRRTTAFISATGLTV